MKTFPIKELSVIKVEVPLTVIFLPIRRFPLRDVSKSPIRLPFIRASLFAKRSPIKVEPP